MIGLTNKTDNSQIHFAGMQGNNPIPTLVNKDYSYFFNEARSPTCLSPLVGQFTYIPCVECQRVTSTIAAEEQLNLNIFPNPFDYNIALANQNELYIKNIRWIDISGRLLATQNINSNNNQINVESNDFQPGIYFITIETERGSTTFKMVKTQ